MLSDVVAFTSLIVSLVSFWVTVLWVMPAVARARVHWQAAQVHDRVIDAILDDQIEIKNPRADDVLMFCHLLEAHSRELNLTNAAATIFATRNVRESIQLRREIRTETSQRESKGMATYRGDVVLRAAERHLDRITAHYFVRGSGLWWILVPIQNLSRFLYHRDLPAATEISEAIDQPRPNHIATAVREDQRGSEEPSFPWALPRLWPPDKRHPQLTPV